MCAEINFPADSRCALEFTRFVLQVQIARSIGLMTAHISFYYFMIAVILETGELNLKRYI